MERSEANYGTVVSSKRFGRGVIVEVDLNGIMVCFERSSNVRHAIKPMDWDEEIEWLRPAELVVLRQPRSEE